jgi:hypothetical protein
MEQAPDTKNQRMIVCAGLQSGGTTLVSWYFLQRADTDGVLDMRNDCMSTSFERAKQPILWVKMTVGAFRCLDIYQAYTDLGWKPQPLLVVRDVRVAFDSLMVKAYGFNGTTAEEPPLRMRFRRFLSDWQHFRDNNWPIVKYEELLRDERGCLEAACRELSLPWDEAMILWPKSLGSIAYVGAPNQTFMESMSKNDRANAIQAHKAKLNLSRLPKSELLWLEENFAEYNAFHGYPETATQVAQDNLPSEMAPPAFEGTKRQKVAAEIERLSWIPKLLLP